MSALFENLSYESQCPSNIWPECSKCCVVMLRSSCLYNTWSLNFVMKHPYTPKQSIRAIIARTYITRIIDDSLPHAFALRTLKTSTRCAHMAYKFAPMELNKMPTSHRSLPVPTGSHSSTRSDSIHLDINFEWPLRKNKMQQFLCF